MAATENIFAIECVGATLVLTPASDLMELQTPHIDAGANEVFRRFDEDGCKNVVLDLHRADACGSSALGFFVRVWRRVSDRGGRMVVCNVSEHGKELLRITRLDCLWPRYASRAEALRAVEG
jgi:anti-anti-sigma factor